jgi:hypothetical protein
MLGCEQPCSISKIIIIVLDNNFSSLFHTTRGSEPPSGKNKICTHIVELTQRTRPMASCSGFRRLELKEILHRLMSSMHRTVVIALHSMGYSRFALFSCLVVDKLLQVLHLSRCKVPPMGTQVFHGHLAWVVELDLLPRKIVGELDCCGNFADFADTEQL